MLVSQFGGMLFVLLLIYTFFNFIWHIIDLYEISCIHEREIYYGQACCLSWVEITSGDTN